jgi:hypothetical protein
MQRDLVDGELAVVALQDIQLQPTGASTDGARLVHDNAHDRP